MSEIRTNLLKSERGDASPSAPFGLRVSGVTTSTTLNVTGNATITGNLGVGGTVTYEDVTSIDSVGVITARNGIRVGAGKSIGSDGAAVVYYGDGSNLTGAGPTLANGANNRIVTATGANSLEAESSFTYDVSTNTAKISSASSPRIIVEDTTNTCKTELLAVDTLGQVGTVSNHSLSIVTNNVDRLRIDTSGNVLIGDSAGQIGKLSTLGTGNHISASRHSTDTSAANIILAKYRGTRASPSVISNGDDIGNLSWYGYNGSSIIKAADITAKTNGTVDGSNMTTDLVFSTTSGNTNTERLRIQSDGTVQIGTQSAHTKWVEFADSTRDDATEIRVNNGSNSDFEVVNNRSGGKIKLYTNSSSRFEIDGDGYITNPGKRAAAFCARASSSFNVSQNGIVVYNTTSAGSNNYQAFDIGSNYSTSTGKFTCPVDGIYYFEAQAMTTGWSDNASMQDLLIMKSNRGTVSNPRQRRSKFRSEDDNNGYYTNSVSGLYNGSAGDTVWVIVAHACGISNLGYSYFSGYLVA